MILMKIFIASMILKDNIDKNVGKKALFDQENIDYNRNVKIPNNENYILYDYNEQQKRLVSFSNDWESKL